MAVNTRRALIKALMLVHSVTNDADDIH